jgi:CRP-like cAMP-binding protein
LSSHIVHILGGLPLFESVREDRLGDVARIFTARTFERGEELLADEADRSRTHVIASGSARVTRLSVGGRSVGLIVADSGDLIGALPFEGGRDDAERAGALERCTTLSADAGDFEALLEDEPTIALAVLGSLSQRLRATSRRFEALAVEQVPARLARVLLDLSDRYGKVTATGVRVDVRITHGQLAEQVATTRETLTKVAGWLRSEQIASLERRQIWIADYAALEQVAEGQRTMPGRTRRGNGSNH